MNNKIVTLGIDPGIANTALAIVKSNGVGYTLGKTLLVKSTPKQSESIRLLKIYESVYEILDTPEYKFNAVAIEKVFHNKNVSSSIKTGKAIGAALTAAAQHDIPVIELTPQQVKSASGLSNKANKDNLIRAASGIFKTDITNHHLADASLCALAGVLRQRSDSSRRAL